MKKLSKALIALLLMLSLMLLVSCGNGDDDEDDNSTVEPGEQDQETTQTPIIKY